MKKRLFILLFVIMLAAAALPGCQSAQRGLDAAGNALERQVDSAGNAISQAAENSTTFSTTHASSLPKPALTLEEAQKIALEHAGLTADQVTQLHTEYEIEHGIPQYDVEFHQSNWEYDYEIQADTGEILSFSKDD